MPDVYSCVWQGFTAIIYIQDIDAIDFSQRFFSMEIKRKKLDKPVGSIVRKY